MSFPRLANGDARRLFLDRHLLLSSSGGSGAGADLDGVLHDLGFVQVDSVNTLARAHDLILWSRRRQYRPAALERAVARRRSAFEHWTHDAAVIPMAFYPMWRLKRARDAARIAARWSRNERAARQAEIDRVLRHVSDHGVTSTRDVGEDAGGGGSGWWNWSPSKAALDYLWRRGDLAVCHRRGFRKHYDLARRVIPADVLDAWLEDAAIVDWAMGAALARLGFGTAGDLADFFDIVTRDEARDWAARALAEDRVVEIDVAGADGALRRCLTAPDIEARLAGLPDPSSRVRILSPFDPALRDRRRAERLFGFSYRIEIFVPEERRRYGYYVFPVWQGLRAVGRIDARREGDRMSVRAFWPERGVRMGRARRAGLVSELERVSSLAGLRGMDMAPGWLRG